ncbi:fimbrial protein [Escherichia coli]|uniref:fimbrial protein n=1 Tax=Escherichia coli TaxID=562 RepID=UPI00191AB8A2|nr:fimbrial protein [Escherichia coli]
MMKTVMAGAVAMALVSFGANAANQGQGKIYFEGQVISAPCGIDDKSADQSINFGQISKATLEEGGISQVKPIEIKLVNCNATELAKTHSVKLSFTGTTISNAPTELGTSGDTGTAVVISEASGQMVSFNGTPGALTKLKEGDNTLLYSSWVKKATNGTVKEGSFNAVTNFALAYE